MGMELPPLVQKFMVDVSGLRNQMNSAADAVKNFGSGSAKGIGDLRTSLDEVKIIARALASTLRGIGPDTRASISAASAEFRQLERAISGPLAATRQQLAALRQLQAASANMGRMSLASDLSKSMGALTFPGFFSPAKEFKARQANQAALEAMISQTPGAEKKRQDDYAGRLILQTERRNQERIGAQLEDMRQQKSFAVAQSIQQMGRRMVPLSMAPDLQDVLKQNALKATTEMGGIDFSGPNKFKQRIQAERDAARERKIRQAEQTLGISRRGEMSPEEEDAGQLAIARRIRAGAPGAPGMMSRLGGMFGKGGAFGGLVGRLGSGYMAFHGLQQAGRGIQEAAESYIKAGIEAHKIAATTVIGGMGTASTAFVSGVGRGVTGLIHGLSESLQGLMEGGPVSIQVKALGGTVSEMVGSIHDIFSGVVSGIGQALGGQIGAEGARRHGNIGTLGGIGQTAGGLGMAGGSIALASGAVGGPVGLAIVGASAAISTISGIVTSTMQAAVAAETQIVQSAVQAMTGIFSSMLNVVAQGLTAAINLTTTFVSGLMSAGIEAQRLAATFGVLTGSKEGGRALFGDIQGLASTSPYLQQALQGAAQTLLEMGVSADGLVSTLKVLGDVAVGDSTRLQRLASIFAEVTNEGRLTPRQIKALAGVGITIKDLAQTMGISSTEFQNITTKQGGVPGDVLRQTLNRLSGPGGRMAGFAGENLDTVGGQWNRLSGIVQVTAAKMGEAFNKSAGFANMFKNVGDFVERSAGALEKFASKMGEMVLPVLAKMKDIFLEIVDVVVKVGAELSKLVGIVLSKLPEILPTMVKNLAGALDTALSGKMVRGFLGGNAAEALRGGLNEFFISLMDQIADRQPLGHVWKPGEHEFNPAGIGKGKGGMVWKNAKWPILQGIADWMMNAPNKVGDFLKGMHGGVNGLFGGGDNPISGMFRSLEGLGKQFMGAFGIASHIPLTKEAWENQTRARLQELRSAASSAPRLSDNLPNANLRGSEGAYETFAKSWAEAMGPQNLQEALERAAETIAEQTKATRDEIDAIKAFPDDVRAKLGFPDAKGIN